MFKPKAATSESPATTPSTNMNNSYCLHFLNFVITYLRTIYLWRTRPQKHTAIRMFCIIDWRGQHCGAGQQSKRKTKSISFLQIWQICNASLTSRVLSCQCASAFLAVRHACCKICENTNEKGRSWVSRKLGHLRCGVSIGNISGSGCRFYNLWHSAWRVSLRKHKQRDQTRCTVLPL